MVEIISAAGKTPRGRCCRSILAIPIPIAIPTVIFYEAAPRLPVLVRSKRAFMTGGCTVVPVVDIRSPLSECAKVAGVQDTVVSQPHGHCVVISHQARQFPSVRHDDVTLVAADGIVLSLVSLMTSLVMAVRAPTRFELTDLVVRPVAGVGASKHERVA